MNPFDCESATGEWMCAEWRKASGTEIFWVQTVRKCKTWTRQRQKSRLEDSTQRKFSC